MLHVDRSTIQLDQGQRREWALDRSAGDVRTGRPAAEVATDEGAVAVAGLGASSHHVELKAVAEAEELVRRILEGGASLRGAHAGIDPARAARLIAD